MSEEHICYTITTKTSSELKEASTDAQVSIQIIGECEKRSTDWHVLDKFLRDDFELGRTDCFKIKARDVGRPYVIRLKICKKKDWNGWLCETVTVTGKSHQVQFSVFDWVHDDLAVCAGKATLPQKEKSLLVRDLRRIEVDRKRHVYQWHLKPTEDQSGWCLPRYLNADDYKELPFLFRINDEQLYNFQQKREVALYNSLIDFGKNLFGCKKIANTDDYQKFFHHPSLPKDMPPFFKTWSTDEEFGRQMLNGVNPTTIFRCRHAPQEFLQAEKEIFQNGLTFESEIAAKRLFCINYRVYSAGIMRNCSKSGKLLHCADSVALFRVGDDGRLRPIAIQLEENGEVFTPMDGEYDWLLAKLYFRNTDVNMHEWKYHFLRTHAVMEPVAIGMFRSLSQRHPVYKLLRPHLQTVPAINTLARQNLVGPNAAANFSLSINGLEMARCGFRTLEFDDLVLPKVFEEQGTAGCDILPFYYYRDDALMLWSAIENFIGSVLQLYYHDDKDVVEDYELQSFVNTVAIDGIAFAGLGLKGYPTELKSFQELLQYITMIVFTCSVQHAACNFGQFEIYKFVPNAPGGMRLPPHKKGEGNAQRMLDTLPDNLMSVLQLGTAFTLSTYAPNEVYLGNFPLKLFEDGEVDKQQEDFRKSLRFISEQIHARNDSADIPYTYLLPERIPNSIAV